MSRLLNLAAILCLSTAPLAAQTGPNTPQILSALIAAAPTAQILSYDGTPTPEVTGPELLTLILYDLGIHAPSSTELYAFSASCDPAPESADWNCRVQLNIDWHGGESGHILRFALTPTAQSCAPRNLETFGPYDPCAWALRDRQITYLLAG